MDPVERSRNHHPDKSLWKKKINRYWRFEEKEGQTYTKTPHDILEEAHVLVKNYFPYSGGCAAEIRLSGENVHKTLSDCRCIYLIRNLQASGGLDPTAISVSGVSVVEFKKEIVDLLKAEKDVETILKCIDERVERFAWSAEDIIPILWDGLVAAVDWSSRPERIQMTLLELVEKYHTTLTAISSPKSEIALLHRIQKFCYDDKRFMDHYLTIVQNLYKHNVVSDSAIIYWAEKGAAAQGKTVFVKQMELFVSSCKVRQPYLEGDVIHSRFRIHRRIGRGGCEVVFKGTDLDTSELVAIKTQPRERVMIGREVTVYKVLGGEEVVASLKWSGTDRNLNVLVIDILGPSLEDLFNFCGRKFTLKTVAAIALQAIYCLDYMHSKRLLHRDIKPDNFLMGLGKKGNILHIIDFGLACSFVDSYGHHIKERSGLSVIGTERYCSLTSHNGISQGRRDDLMSPGYVLIYFCRGSLPWQGLKDSTKEKRRARIRELKERITMEELCLGLPNEFAVYLNYTRSLRFDDKPDYDYACMLFERILRREGGGGDGDVDWDWINRFRVDRQNAPASIREWLDGVLVDVKDTTTKPPSPTPKPPTPPPKPSSPTPSIPCLSLNPKTLNPLRKPQSPPQKPPTLPPNPQSPIPGPRTNSRDRSANGKRDEKDFTKFKDEKERDADAKRASERSSDGRERGRDEMGHYVKGKNVLKMERGSSGSEDGKSAQRGKRMRDGIVEVLAGKGVKRGRSNDGSGRSGEEKKKEKGGELEGV
ncbi:Casein kinase I isoform delta [Rhizophlyctis rosea]|uniref:non-specific serine/threonine protein kinase n=1 Tax=Rhizophlyctis rosea TaxID=64517 RepID=A0AAD5SIL9_9FUNG|nr:Casein kinase I isoform delta [Rhizophlyctis rosea]